MDLFRSRFHYAALLPAFLLSLSATGYAATLDDDAAWNGGLKELYFGNQPIEESDDLIELDAPYRAENAAFVPLSITAKIPQTKERYIETIYLVVDKNPGPLAGRFHFTSKSGRADLSLRVRVNAYTPVRAIAQTNDGRLHMSRRFVKASGGCSAPVGTDLEKAMARMGKMKIKIPEGATAEEPTLMQLLVSHPNINGMQMDQVTHLYTPAHFVKQVRVSFEGEEIFWAETDFAISENPSFRFYFVPDGEGELVAEVIDTEGLTFKHTYRVTPESRGLAQN